MTNRKKDLFDLFRENERRLKKAPSPRAWSQLERRLNDRRRRNRISLARTIGMAAAVLLLAVITVLIATAVGQKRSIMVNQSPLAAEELETGSSEVNEEWQLAVKARRAEQVRRRPINEGQPDQKLIPANVSPADAQQTGLQQLRWIEGSWRTSGGAQEVQWKRAGQHAIEGTLQPAGVGGRMEHMRLYAESSQLFFTTDLGGDHTRHFKLTTVQPRQLIFRNMAPGFPEQVVLRRDSRGHYSMTYSSGQPDTGRKPTALVGKPLTRQFYRMQLQ